MVMMWWNNGSGYGMGWLLMGIAMIIFWVIVVVGVLALFRNSRTNRTPTQDSPLEALDKRFARGEIDAEEYRSRKEILGAEGKGRST